MDISEGSAEVKKEEDAMFFEIVDNDIKTEIVKEEPKETVFFIKCEMCNENSANESECAHVKNHRLSDILQVGSLCLIDGLHNNSFKEDVKPKVENTNSSSSQNKEDSIMMLIVDEITIKEEEYLDISEHLSTNTDFGETGEVKTEDDDIFCENVKIESEKEEPTDNEASWSSGMWAQDEDGNEDVQTCFSKESLKGFKEDVKPKVENTNSSSYQNKKDSIMMLIDDEVTMKEEEYLDISEHLSTNTDFCETGEVKTEDDDIFCENVKIESVKGEPTDNEASCSSGMWAQDEDGNEDVQTSFSKESRKDYLKRVNETNKDTLQCQVCFKSFSKHWDLVKHGKTHSGEKPFNCKVCSKSFSTSGGLVIHERTHTGEKPFNCKVCSKSFVTRGGLVRHERTHTGEKPFNCKVCSKSFNTSGGLVIHERTHTGEKPFNCKVCSKSFVTRGDLVRHERTHTGEKPFRCKFCSKSFSNRNNLVTHQRIHTGEKPFNCKLCDKAFTQCGVMKRHERSHTKENQLQKRKSNTVKESNQVIITLIKQ